jgi:multiple sugar transport system substrate-binding protein
MLQQVKMYNAQHEDVRIELTLIPEGGYNAQVQAAALADDLPDLLEFDGPFVYSYVWQGHLIPLDDLLSESSRTNLIPSIIRQGTYRGKLYSVGMFDSGLALFARRSRLEAVGARIPRSPEEAWSTNEFLEILQSLAREDEDGRVLDLKLNYTGEWFTYGFLPVLTSAGDGWKETPGEDLPQGVFDNPDCVAAMKQVQSWIANEFVDPNLDDYAFLGGRVALSWVGHWEYERYAKAHADDLVLVPLPDFGQGTRTGQGSWNWGITRGCALPEQAVRFLEFLLEDEQILSMTRRNAAVPATRTAIAKSSLHQPGGLLHLYVEQLVGGYSVPRPRTPAYPVITESWQKAFDDIRHGADVATALARVAREVRQDIRSNQGYPTINR